MRKFGIKIIIFIILIALSNELLIGNTNETDYSKYLNIIFGDDKGKVYDKIPGYKTIVKTDIEKAYNELWNKFTNSGPSKLPACVVEAFEALRGQKINIIYFAEGIDAHPHGLYGSAGIIKIFNTYKTTACELQSLLFHELLHKAFTEMSQKEKQKDQKDRSFCVKIITEYVKKCTDKSEVTDYECTNTFNFGSDEAIVEDCELALFPCGLDYYKKNYDPGDEGYKDDGARYFNPPGNDCTEDKLCKKKDKDCLDDCPEDEKCPGKTPDNMDDNYSFSSGTLSDYKLAPESLIYKGGFIKKPRTCSAGCSGMVIIPPKSC